VTVARSATHTTWCTAMATRGDGHRPTTARMHQPDGIDSACRRHRRDRDTESIRRRLAVVIFLLVLIAGGMATTIVLLIARER
jgi:hypothetical protein